MDLYDDEGNLDYDKARTRAREADRLGDARVKEDWLRTLQTVALVDIAASLGVIAADAALSLQEDVRYVEFTSATEAAGRVNPPDDFFVVGDLVVVKGDSDPGEVVGVGMDQGDAYANVVFANGAADRYYTRNLERIGGTFPEAVPGGAAERILDAVDDDGTPEIPVEDEAPGEIEDDFEETDGRPVSTLAEKKAAAEAAADAKKAREKAAKKGRKS